MAASSAYGTAAFVASDGDYFMIDSWFGLSNVFFALHYKYTMPWSEVKEKSSEV